VCIYIYIGVLTVNIEFMWRGLETEGKRPLDKEHCIYILMFFFKLVEASSLAKD
jgi:hypothetical protein